MRFFRVKHLLAPMFIVVTNCAAQAGPDETTNRLMDEKVSILDFGILRLQLKLANSRISPVPNVSFNWDDNSIELKAYSIAPKDQTLDVIKENCASWFWAVRATAGLSDSTGMPTAGRSSNFAEFFGHFGYTNKIDGKAISDTWNDLDKKFRLTYWTRWHSDSAPDVVSISCEGRLLSTGFSVTENKVAK